ncbi:hypothetical protein D3C86_1322130 [compost metagenome]
MRKVQRLKLELEGSRFEPSAVEQIAHHPIQAIRSLEDLRRVLPLARGQRAAQLLLEELGVPHDRGDRSAQVMRHQVDEVALQGIEFALLLQLCRPQAQLLLLAFPQRPLSQHADPQRDVLGQLGQEPHLLRIESVRLDGIHHEGSQHPLIQDDGQGDR